MLLEAIVAVGLLTTVLAAAVGGLATGSQGVSTVHDVTTAQNIARSQLEHSMNAAFCADPCSYTKIATPTGFTVTSQTQPYDTPDPNLEYVVVTVYQDGVAVATSKGIKSNR